MADEEKKAAAVPAAPPAEEKQDPGKTIGEYMKEEGLMSEPSGDDSEKEKAPGIVELSIRIDKLEGKLDLSKEMLDTMSDRISDIVERMGDLRRMVLDREQDASELEADFDKVRTIVKELDPAIIVRRFEKFEEQVEKQNSYLEKNKTQMDTFSDRIKKMEEKFSAIKGFENLVDITAKISDSTRKMEETKVYSERMASKIESIFSEVKSNLASLKKEREMILSIADLANKLVKDVDTLEIKFDEEAVKRKELDGIKEGIEKDAKGISSSAFELLRKRLAAVEMDIKTTPELEDEKRRMLDLLGKTKSDYESKKLSSDAFNDLKIASDIKLSQIDAALVRRGKIIKKVSPPPEEKKPEPVKEKEPAKPDSEIPAPKETAASASDIIPPKETPAPSS